MKTRLGEVVMTTTLVPMTMMAVRTNMTVTVVTMCL